MMFTGGVPIDVASGGTLNPAVDSGFDAAVTIQDGGTLLLTRAGGVNGPAGLVTVQAGGIARLTQADGLTGTAVTPGAFQAGSIIQWNVHDPPGLGNTSPGMVRDQVRIYRDVTAGMGIKLGMHYSGVVDVRAIELHPDWAAVDAEGKPHPRSTCRTSPYVDELMIPQMIELIDNYDVDGFWVDGENWGSTPCWCDKCKAEFTRRTGIDAVPTDKTDEHWHAWLDFHRRLFVDYVTHYTEAVHARKRECLVCSNWMYTMRQPESVEAPVDYISGDYTPSWGANRAAMEGRFIDSRNMTWDLMAWGFTFGWVGDKRGPMIMKPAVHLCQEVAGVVALGGAVMVYMKPERTGHLVGWHHDILDDVSRFCRDRQTACHKTRTASEAAILHLSETLYAHNDPLYNLGRAQVPVEGVLHAMMDTGRSVDLLCRDRVLEDLSNYKLIVAARQDHIDDDVMVKLTDWVRAGGNLLMTGTHLSGTFGDLVGTRPEGDLVEGHVAVACRGRSAGAWGPWQPVSPAEGTEAVRRSLKRQDPACGTTDRVVMTRRALGQGTVLAVHGPLFESYFNDHSPWTRQLIDELVGELGIDWTVTHDGPPWCELIVRRRDDRLVVNLLNRGAADTLTPDKPVVESITPLTDVTVTVRMDAAPRQVRLHPSGPIDWHWADGQLKVTISTIPIHCALEIG